MYDNQKDDQRKEILYLLIYYKQDKYDVSHNCTNIEDF